MHDGKGGHFDLDSRSLCDDYWEGFYLSDGCVVLCSDPDGKSVEYSVYSLKDGTVTEAGSIPYAEGDMFGKVSEALRARHGIVLHLMVSSEAEHPDRHAEILRVLESGEVFDMVRIHDLVNRLSTPSLRMFIGKIGGMSLYEGRYEGFYLLSDRTILYCRDCTDWDPSQTGSIADGAVMYWILKQQEFSLARAEKRTEGYLFGDTFADFITRLPGDRRLVSALGLRGSEEFTLLENALDGDGRSAELANHRMRLSLRL